MALRIAIPNKGRLAEGSLGVLRQIGLRVASAREDDRRLYAHLADKYSVLFVRAADIPEFVRTGVVDCGITGHDLVAESGKNVAELLDLHFGHCRLVVAAPDDSPAQSIGDVPEGALVATAFPNLTSAFFAKHAKHVRIVPITGAAEITPQLGVADLITDLVETGSTLALHRLREIGTVLTSTATFIGNPAALEDPKRGARMRELVGSLESVVHAQRKRYLMANLPRSRLEEVRALIPGVSGPTIMNLMGKDDWVAVHAVVSEDEVNGIIACLKGMGATGILVLPIERMVL